MSTSPLINVDENFLRRLFIFQHLFANRVKNRMAITIMLSAIFNTLCLFFFFSHLVASFVSNTLRPRVWVSRKATPRHRLLLAKRKYFRCFWIPLWYQSHLFFIFSYLKLTKFTMNALLSAGAGNYFDDFPKFYLLSKHPFFPGKIKKSTGKNWRPKKRCSLLTLKIWEKNKSFFGTHEVRISTKKRWSRKIWNLPIRK